MDLLMQTMASRQIDLAIIPEPNKNMTAESPWICDKNQDVALKVCAGKVGILKTGIKNRGFVWIETSDVVIYGCYVSPNITIGEYKEYLSKLGEDIRKQAKNCIIAGDFNAKAGLWGSQNADERGDIIMEWMAGLNLIVHNLGDRPTFHRGTHI